MQDSITHSGVVVSENGNCAVVRIEQLSACSQCHAAAMCNVSDKKDKLIDAIIPEGVKVECGDIVEIKSKRENKSAAIALAYILPLFLMVAVLFLSILGLGLSETAGALMSIGILVIYYGALWFFKDKLKKRFVFYIQANNHQL